MVASVHEGEQAVQRRAGEGGPSRGSPMFTAEIPHGFGRFMRGQQLIAIGAEDDEARMWCTVVTGAEGFVDAIDDRTIVIHALPPEGDPMRELFDDERDFGMVVMSPATMRRVRVNGIAKRHADTLVVHTGQVLGNCPKYLQVRTVDEVVPQPSERVVATGGELNAEQAGRVESADTFFIASRSPKHGADTSHRGGQPGFVTVRGPRKLAWPDYMGNSFYMTLGNMELNPKCGLVFLDWATGDTLQLTGTGRIDWNEKRAKAYPGALRIVEFDVDSVVQVGNASRLRWTFLQYSRFNPPAPENRPIISDGIGRTS